MADTVDKELRNRIIGITEHRYFLALMSFPVPVRKQMKGVVFPVPYRPVEIIPVLGKPCQVDNTEITAAAWPISVIRSGLSQIVETCPYKLPDGVWSVFHCDEVFLRQVAP